MTVHTIDEALSKFDLVSGVGSEADGKACAMTLLAWMAGKPWTDRPDCAHPIIADGVIRANDAPDTTPTMREELVRAGQTGILDTWWIPGVVIAWALSGERGKEPPSQYERALTAVKRLGEWKVDKPRPDLRGANLGSANLGSADLGSADLGSANLRGADLRSANLRSANLAGANLAGANLGGANLRGANLRGANLGGADLGGADLGSADLGSANLAGADLRSANLLGAYANSYTIFPEGAPWTVPESGLVVPK